MKSFSILGGKAHVVELPEGAIKPRITQPFGIYLTFNDRFGFNRIKLPPGIWQIVGMLPEVTEEQAARMVDDATFKYPYIFKRKFEDYSSESENDHDTAIESLESAILAEGYGFHSEPEPSYSDCEQYENPMRTYEGRLREWNSKQSRVLCRERTLILKRN